MSLECFGETRLKYKTTHELLPCTPWYLYVEGEAVYRNRNRLKLTCVHGPAINFLEMCYTILTYIGFSCASRGTVSAYMLFWHQLVCRDSTSWCTRKDMCQNGVVNFDMGMPCGTTFPFRCQYTPYFPRCNYIDIPLWYFGSDLLVKISAILFDLM